MTGCSQKPMLGSHTSTMTSQMLGMQDTTMTTRSDDTADAACARAIVTSSTVSDVLTRIMQRSSEALRTAPAMQHYLTAAGVSNPAVWSAFRLGAGSDLLTAELTAADWTTLANGGLTTRHSRTLGAAWSTGINLPTIDPRQPEHVVGVIRLTPAQHHHRFITQPAGIACATDIIHAPRIILADTPLLGLRLANYGVTGVAIVEDPVVLPDLVEWLHGREIIIAGFRTANRAAMRAALGPLGAQATEVMVLPEIERSPLASKQVLGFGTVPQPPAPLSQHLLRDLHRYACTRIAAGDGAAALRALHIDDARFIDTYAIGYLPADFHRALSSDQQKIVSERIAGHALVVPALDADGIVVDLMCVPVTDGTVIPSVHDTSCGLIGARVATAYDYVIIVDSLTDAADLAADEQRNVLLLRGPTDATANANRLMSSGVRRVEVRCERNRDAMVQILREAHLEIVTNTGETSSVIAFPISNAHAHDADAEAPVTQPTSPEVTNIPASPITSLTLVAHDQRTEQATFSADDLTYVCDVPWDERTRVGLRIRRGGLTHPDRLDLAEDAQRRRCASSAALRTGSSAAVIAEHLAQLHVAIRDLAIRDLASRAQAPLRSVAASSPVLSEADRMAALKMASDPCVFDRIIADVSTLGWIGEASDKRFTVLAALSRNLDQPIWVALTTSMPSQRAAGLDVIAAITPPEQQMHVSRLTDNTFFYADTTALAHKLLILDDATTISSGVATAMRVLRRRGALSAPRVERDPLRGEVRTTFVEIHGPIAVLTASGGATDPQLQPYVVELAADESPEHLAQVQAERCRRVAHAAGNHDAERERILTRLHQLQRVLVPRRVTIPYAERITGFGTSPRAQRDHETLLALIAAHALLHQHQRPDVAGSVVALVDDFTAAASLMHERMAMAQTGLGQHAQRLLTTITSSQVTSFTMQDLSRLLPEWSRHALRTGLTELIALDHLVSPRGGRGAARIYSVVGGVVAAAPNVAPRITLRPVGELAEVGETTIANFTAHQDTG
jgi:hypothetical protein